MAERRSACPLNATLEVLGDRWSLLIVRDLIFKGRTTYKDFLAGGEGIATGLPTYGKGARSRARTGRDDRVGCWSLPDGSAARHDPGDDAASRAVPCRHPLARWRRLTLPRPIPTAAQGRGGPCRKNSTRPHTSAAAGRLERPLKNCDPSLAVPTVTQHRRLLTECFPIALG